MNAFNMVGCENLDCNLPESAFEERREYAVMGQITRRRD